jgi:hypothetical protein
MRVVSLGLFIVISLIEDGRSAGVDQRSFEASVRLYPDRHRAVARPDTGRNAMVGVSTKRKMAAIC